MQTKQVLNIEKIRNDFKILKRKNLIYLDNSATSLTPDCVVETMNKYYEEYNANVHRGIYAISQKATEEYELAHKKAADFINAKFNEIIFTKSATESLNMLAHSLTKSLNKEDEILLSEMEHHSNIVPWQEIAKQKSLTIKYIPITQKGELNMQKTRELITNKTKIVSVTHMSNVLGVINNVKELAKLAHAKQALFILDAAQSVPHFAIDVKELDCDFLAFSGHKMFGPTGIGVLYGKEILLNSLEPFMFGGGMISEVTFESSTWNELPWKFEAGTPNIAGAIGLGGAIDYLNEIGMKNIEEYEENLTSYALEKLNEIKGIKIYNNKLQERGSVISFNLSGIHPHDISTLLDRKGIAIRGGHMCAMPLIKEKLNESSVCRVSLSFYNTLEEIDKLVNELKKIKEMFS